MTNISCSESIASTPSSTTTSSASKSCSRAEKIGHFLVRVFENSNQVRDKSSVLVWIEEGSGPSLIAHPSCTTNPMHVLVYLLGKIKVDNVANTGNIQSS
uniref:Uncharacterized protein n=1 Tax=Cacopsylla melanoneura TaxID=428564 RepID=A0A8D8QY29_9HEMI